MLQECPVSFCKQMLTLSGEELGDGGIPLPLRAQNQLNHFANGAAAAGFFRNICRGSFGVGGGVGDSDRKADAPEDRNILYVVTEVTHFVGRKIGFSCDHVESLHLFASKPLVT